MAEKVEKERLDVLLVQQGLANSRELAKAYIMAGNVYVDGQKEDKAGTKVAVTAKLEVKGNQMKYVSRGGYKLEKAMDVFGIRLDGKICLDFSPIKGPEGNIEYLIYLDKSRSGMHEDEVQARVDTVVAQSHKILSGEK